MARRWLLQRGVANTSQELERERSSDCVTILLLVWAVANAISVLEVAGREDSSREDFVPVGASIGFNFIMFLIYLYCRNRPARIVPVSGQNYGSTASQPAQDPSEAEYEEAPDVLNLT